MTDNKQKIIDTIFPHLISTIALIVSVISLFFTYYGFPGKIEPLKPSGYGIIRGIGSFPSDHIVMSMEWRNSGGNPIQIKYVHLHLYELNPDSQETGKKYQFFLNGEYPEVSKKYFPDLCKFIHSFSIPPKTMLTKVLLFRNDSSSFDTSSLYNFRFESNQFFKVNISFDKESKPLEDFFLTYMPIHSEVSKMDSLKWNYWELD